MEFLISLTSWLTPTTLFLLLNFVIFTIFITTRFSSGSISKNRNHYNSGSGHELHTPTPLTKAPSIIDRVKSINFHRYKSPSPFLSDIHLTGSDPKPTSPSSLLARVKSINIPYFKFEFPLHNRENDYAAYELSTKSNPEENFKIDEEESGISDLDNPLSIVQAPSILARVKSFKLPIFHISEPQSNSISQEEELPIGAGSSDLDRPSILERVKSFKLLSVYRSEPESNSIPQEEANPVRTKSETVKPVKMKKKMRRSSSEKVGLGYIGREVETVKEVEMRRPETMREEKTTSFGEDGEECVNDKASNFINKFKQQLKLQRLDSFLRYRDMLKND